MDLIIWLVIVIMFLYAVGFAITLWKEQNKKGAIAVFILAIMIVVVPFFSVLQ
ncbi:hypothetical protein ACH0B5_01025 [Ureibacillus sp. 179-F W5.1 NHS]|uniref:Uncharacterized protein n=1 Tax=Ureibacillus galli TaxID=2762222 RepID=A0ABR8XEC3_9BACL|nr:MULTISPECIES: hypothetical protein [Bacillales]MBD8027562.1 hypothetical protein [Ureibacillus galli]